MPGWLQVKCQTLDLSPGVDLSVIEFKPHIGLHGEQRDYLKKKKKKQL